MLFQFIRQSVRPIEYNRRVRVSVILLFLEVVNELLLSFVIRLN